MGGNWEGFSFALERLTHWVKLAHTTHDKGFQLSSDLAEKTHRLQFLKPSAIKALEFVLLRPIFITNFVALWSFKKFSSTLLRHLQARNLLPPAFALSFCAAPLPQTGQNQYLKDYVFAEGYSADKSSSSPGIKWNFQFYSFAQPRDYV